MAAKLLRKLRDFPDPQFEDARRVFTCLESEGCAPALHYHTDAVRILVPLPKLHQARTILEALTHEEQTV